MRKEESTPIPATTISQRNANDVAQRRSLPGSSMKSGLIGAGIGGSVATHSRHSHSGNYVSRDDANTVIGDRPTLRSGSFCEG